MRISDWSSDVCSSDLLVEGAEPAAAVDSHRLLHLRVQAAHAGGACHEGDRQESGPESQHHQRTGAVERQRRPGVGGIEAGDRKSVVEGKSVSGRGNVGGRRIHKKKKAMISNKK